MTTKEGQRKGYNPQKLGFFMIPADPQSNNARIFVVNRNSRQVKPFGSAWKCNPKILA